MPPLSSDDRRALLARARQAIVAVLVHREIPDFGPPPPGALAQPGAAFVTLRWRSELRGCVGQTKRDLSLAETVAQCAIGAASHDERFPPLRPDELTETEIEISVLSEMFPVRPDQIEIGRYGLLMIRGRDRGLLLPQVAVERGWRPERFLAETCRKAGLEAEAWRDPQTEILAFTADRFAESEFAAAKKEEARPGAPAGPS